MIEFSLNFSLDEGLSFFGLMDPFSEIITHSKADVDNISIVLLFSGLNVNKFYGTSEISFFVKSVGKVSAYWKSVFVTLLTEKFSGERISSLKEI